MVRIVGIRNPNDLPIFLGQIAIKKPNKVVPPKSEVGYNPIN